MAIAKNGEENKALGLSGALLTPEEEKKKEQEAAATAPAPSTQPSTAPTTATQTAPAVKPIPTQQKAGTGTFANLKSYLEANKGSKVASATAQRIEKATTGAQKTLGQTQSQFQQQMQAGSLSKEDLEGKALQDIAGITAAARGVSYQAPQTPATETAPQPQQYLTPEQQERFKEVITAQYAGPYALQEIGSYGELQKRAQEAGTLASQAQDISTRADLLRSVFGRGREYTSGQAKLDELLLGQTEQGVQNIQQKAQQAADVKRQLQAAGIEKATEASQRERDIANIQQEAREQFIKARSDEELATEARIKEVQKNWNKLPEYFKNLLKNTAKPGSISRVEDLGRIRNALYDKYVAAQDKGTTYSLSKEEAALLGLNQNQPIFITPEMVRGTSVAKGEELVSKDEVARQLALSELANLDLKKELQKSLLYSDLQKAGSKDILSSIDTKKIKDIQQEQKQKMEKELNKKVFNLFGTNQLNETDNSKLRMRAYNALDLLKAGGYIPSGMQGIEAEDYSKKLLKDIAEGKAYKSANNIQNTPSSLERIFDKASDVITDQQLARLGLPPIRDIMEKYSALDTVKVVENAETKARAQALRDLLKGIY